MLSYLKILLDSHFAKSEERGASAVEYGLLIAGIAAVIVAVVFLLGGNILDAFNQTNNCVDTNGANCAP
jgi:pilus assembly protein Flp/PilA